jgi:hypothetical protein
MEYGGSLALDPPSPEDEVNVIAALKQSHRVRSISLTVTTSLQHKLYVIKRLFWELEDLILLSRASVPPTLPSAFLWCPRLRRLHLTRISFPPLVQLLHFSRDIVDLQLHEALSPLVFLNGGAHGCLVRDGPAPITFTPFSLRTTNSRIPAPTARSTRRSPCSHPP